MAALVLLFGGGGGIICWHSKKSSGPNISLGTSFGISNVGMLWPKMFVIGLFAALAFGGGGSSSTRNRLIVGGVGA